MTDFGLMMHLPCGGNPKEEEKKKSGGEREKEGARWDAEMDWPG